MVTPEVPPRIKLSVTISPNTKVPDPELPCNVNVLFQYVPAAPQFTPVPDALQEWKYIVPANKN